MPKAGTSGRDDDDAKPVQWIVEQYTQLWGEGASWTIDQAEHPHEAHYLKLDCSKARLRLDWQPKWSLAQALEYITAWHKAHLLEKNMREFSLSQIAAYQEQATS